MTARTDAHDDLLVACTTFVGRAGATNFQLRFSDDETPVVWIAVAEFRDGAAEAAAALSPALAAVRLVEQLADGGTCAHCGRPSGATVEWKADMPLADVVCWSVYDPEVKRFRRSCEGDTTGRAFGIDAQGRTVGRNDPCPCGSGAKWKRCHGAPQEPEHA